MGYDSWIKKKVLDTITYANDGVSEKYQRDWKLLVEAVARLDTIVDRVQGRIEDTIYIVVHEILDEMEEEDDLR